MHKPFALAALRSYLVTAFFFVSTSHAADDAPRYLAFTPPGSMGHLHYFVSQPAADVPPPTAAVMGIHGHPRDASKTFNAALLAVQRGDALPRTLVVAPVFQVDATQDAKCKAPGVPAAQTGDLLWTCASWIAGEAASNAPALSSFAALDALVVELHQRWPSLQTITIAGFSAGAQMVQHYIGFAADAPPGLRLRYVVSDPGTWLYFDVVRPQTTLLPCPNVNQWKYGVEALPSLLGRSAAEARSRYAQADIHYLEGALDSSDAPGAFYKILDKSCAAMAQGPYRLQRGLAYATYDREVLAPDKTRTVVVVPGCAHDVACVFPSEAARAALLGR